VRGNDTKLVRICNPREGKYEWKGAWSDASSEWRSVTDTEKRIAVLYILLMESSGKCYLITSVNMLECLGCCLMTSKITLRALRSVILTLTCL